ncbi:DoxX family protein [Hazenella sp. IB182357]|uniref:DoxX family protein n=1 Tax=Polycladospora coralii TaxID=2771432 RepID=A0A926RV17_9BACL|nr:DoxX family protein [Polycladospora coralii]MBD1373064.1 DoxX family protein [Polycladospora coralii]
MKIAVKGIQALVGLAFIFFGSMPLLNAEALAGQMDQFGLPVWFMYITGVLEIIGGIGLLAGLWKHKYGLWGAGLLAVIMVGAIGVHILAGDGLTKTFPAILFLLLTLFIGYGQRFTK